MAARVSPIFPAEGASEVDVATPDGRTLPLRAGELKAVIERRAGRRMGRPRAAFMRRLLGAWFCHCP
jgi:hypothetical protein